MRVRPCRPAPGGVLAELMGEKSLRLAPISEAEAGEMIAEIAWNAPPRPVILR